MRFLSLVDCFLMNSNWEVKYTECKPQETMELELQQKTNDKNLKREPLVNEVEIDVAGKSIEEVLSEAIEIIDTRESLLDYEYVKPPKELFYSWVFANGVR